MEWLFVSEVAKLYSLTERAIRTRVQKGDFGEVNIGYRYVDGMGRGGKQLQIALESLTEAAQARYRGEQVQQSADARLTLNDEQRALLDFKESVVFAYQDFKEAYPKADKRERRLNSISAWERHGRRLQRPRKCA